mmetsp:Transcript_42142/g.98176  ORF Transcript_42142/g.98176 Transcript_42142/m.98176 type:complete len:544 (-) Transcript_42142:95-1726(-)
MTGWYMETSNEEGSQALDPAYYIVWGSNDEARFDDDAECVLGRKDGRWWQDGDTVDWCGATWKQVGAPKWIYDDTPSLKPDLDKWFWFVKLRTVLPTTRGTLLTVQLRPRWFLYTIFALARPCTVSPTAFAVLLVGNLHKYWPHSSLPAPRWFGIIGMGIVCSVGIISAALAAWHRVWHFAAEHFWDFVAHMAGAAVGSMPGVPMSRALYVFTFVYMVGNWTKCAFYFRNPFAKPEPPAIVTLVMALSMSISRFLAMRKAKMLLKQDQTRYDDLWSSLCTEEGCKSLQRLEKAVNSANIDGTNCCQRNHTSSDALPQLLMRQPSLEHATPADRHVAEMLQLRANVWGEGMLQVSSISQLYCQAAIANLLMVERLKEWAECCSGMFPLMRFPGEEQVFARWSEVHGDARKEDMVLWPPMKRHGRTFEKLFRSYRNNASHLLDISRNCMILETVDDLTTCLETILADKNVKVERIKNRMGMGYDTSETGGYRDVCVNLRVVNKESVGLGSDLHVCEVQLLLVQFAHLKSTKGHQRYVASRNVSGN